jgi:hypothetical protein
MGRATEQIADTPGGELRIAQRHLRQCRAHRHRRCVPTVDIVKASWPDRSSYFFVLGAHFARARYKDQHHTVTARAQAQMLLVSASPDDPGVVPCRKSEGLS